MKSFRYLALLLIVTPLMLSFYSRKYKTITDQQVDQVVVRYDPSILRVSGSKLPVGISAALRNGDVTSTPGFLKGETRWRNYKVEVEGGCFLFGNIYIQQNKDYLRNKGLVVKVYHRRSKTLLKTQTIPYNYEADLSLVTRNNFRKAPGNKVDFGILIHYDNGDFKEFWPRSTHDLEKEFIYLCDGGRVNFGNFYINSDPFSIRQHTVRLVAMLDKQPSVSDTLSIVLDYRDNIVSRFSGRSGSNGSSGSSGFSGSSGSDGGHGGDGSDGSNGSRGPELEVFADVYFDTIIHEQLMYFEVNEVGSGKLYRYLVNTDGGTFTVYASGGGGGDGGSGGSGGNGGSGCSGSYVTETIWINDSTSETRTYQLPGGPGGNGGQGGDGGYGGNGGPGGTIYLDYTPYITPYLDLIQAKCPGGSSGNGGSSGWGGSGGSGGSGSPSGTSGSSGTSGTSGSSGSPGSRGDVFYSVVRVD